jgi:hypothetical protein
LEDEFVAIGPAANEDEFVALGPFTGSDEFVALGPASTEDQPSVFADIGRGMGSGAINIVQGISELGALGIDAALNTNTSRSTTEFFEDGKQWLGLVPEGTAGKVAESLVNYGSMAIPVAGWLSRANQVAKGAKVLAGTSGFAKSAEQFGKSGIGKTLLGNRVKLAGTTALGTGAADILVSPSTGHTLADSFDALPDFLQTELDTGLKGADESYRRLRNKLRIGIEGMGLSATVDAAIPVIGAVARSPAYIPGVPAAARVISQGFDKVAARMNASPTLKKYFTSAGMAPRELYEGVEGVKANIEASTQEAASRFAAFDKAAREVVSSSRLFGRGRDGIQEAHDDLYKLMTGDIQESAFRSSYGDTATNAAMSMRTHVDSLTDTFMREIENSGLNATERQTLIDQFQNQQGQYVRRLYEAHLRPEKFVVDQNLYAQSVAEIEARMIVRDPAMAADPIASNNAAKVVVDKMLGRETSSLVDPDTILKQQKMAGQVGKRLAPDGTRRSLFNIAEGMLKNRNPIMDQIPALRSLLGEIKDPKELYLRTVGDMAETLASNQLYRQFDNTYKVDFTTAAATWARGGRPLVIEAENLTPAQVTKLYEARYTKIGEIVGTEETTLAQQAFGGKFGSLSGKYVPNEVADSLTIASRSTGPLQEALAIALQAKGLSQMTKTVLNPISQVRNFHSGVFMLGANGNVAHGMGLFDSARLTVARLTDMAEPEFAKQVDLLKKSGLLDQNYAVNEYRELLREGANLNAANKLAEGTKTVVKYSGLAKPLQILQDVYSGTDNFWKTAGYLGEKGKYSGAFRRAGLDPENLGDFVDQVVRTKLAPRATEFSGEIPFIDLMATDIVKSTMPTYSRVPEAIKQLRRIPFVGNFMAFPAEIVRTSTNITRQGLRELGFKADDQLIQALVRKNSANLTDPAAKLAHAQKQAKELQTQIRAIGAQRLSSYVSYAYVAPIAAQKAAMEILDFTEEQLEALKKFTPDYMKGGTLMPISNPGDGKNVQYVNLSYMMPYDFMLAPAKAALEAYSQRGEVTDSEASKIMAGATIGMQKLFEPFASESLIAERIADVTTRGGVTKTGNEIFVLGDTEGDTALKAFTHVAGGFIPGLLEQFYQERNGKIIPGRALKALRGDPGKYGEEFTTAEELASTLTGFREMDQDFKKSMFFKGVEYASIRNDQQGEFKRTAKANDATNQNIIDAYIKANNNIRRAQTGLYNDTKAMETLGVSPRDIKKYLTERANLGVDEVRRIMRGEFVPFEVSDDLRKQIRDEVRKDGERRLAPELPRSELRDIYRGLRRQPLLIDQQIAVDQDFVPLGPVDQDFVPLGPVDQDFVPLGPVDQDFVPLGSVNQAPIPAPQPQARQQGTAKQPVSPTLLGGNPYEAMKNFELSQYLSRINPFGQ